MTWLAADYDTRLIRKWFEDREWGEISYEIIYYYREKHRDEIESVRQERRSNALYRGVALREERIARLAQHADELESIKWVADPKTGRLWNEKAWRETLAQIADEIAKMTDADADRAIDQILAELATKSKAAPTDASPTEPNAAD